ncbi:glycosyltransferase [Pontibacter ramchanderi]|uniref:Glycosyl transferase family 2 n=1 Tax=Pontibacter ramchanderi TaxID=1179743 RepID=A0A2N3U799_9BACT|nr:glycosyltransferase family A protein [Pontibacter ramchanderi]PKV62617.1 glycosyl transferase family 2 [Pontibacter ramchanderi]
MSSPTPFVSIIIPTYHDWDRLLICLRALETQTYPKEKFEVLVINNAPDDLIPEKIKIDANLEVINEAVPGSYAARNTGIAKAKGSIIGFTDSDCIPDPNWIRAAVSFFDKNQNIDRLGGRVDLFTSGDNYNLAEAYDLIYAFRQEENVSRGVSVTANMFTKKSVLNEVGYFNSNMFSGGDYEWGKRAESKKFHIGFSPDVIVKHPARKSLKQIIDKVRRCASGTIQMEHQSMESSISRLAYLIYEVRPPINEFRHIYARGKHLSLKLKLLVFFLRYNIRVIRAYEEIRLQHGAEPFRDID